MNSTSLHEPAELGRVGARIGQAIWPDRNDEDDGDHLVTLRRAASAVTVVATLVQVVIWMLIGIFAGGLDMPWWLFTLAGGGTFVLVLWLADAVRNDVRREARR